MFTNLLNKKSIIGIILCILFFAFIFFFKQIFLKPNKARITIGIVQTATHPALDFAREGFTTKLKEHFKDNINFIVQNGDGLITNLQSIATSFKANPNIDAFFVIGSPAAQVMHNVEKKRPIFAAAVTNPNALGLVSETSNVCGCSDMIDVKAEIETLRALLPHVKTVALLFSCGEMNSVVMIKSMKNALKNVGIQPVEIGITNEAEIPAATISACRNADAILCPTDHNVAMAINLISSIALKHKKPLFVSDNLLVKNGAFAGQGVDYFEAGKKAGEFAELVLNKKTTPTKLGFLATSNNKIVINKTVQQKLGLILPAKLIDANKEDISFVED